MWRPVQKYWAEKKAPDSKDKIAPELQDESAPEGYAKLEPETKESAWQEDNNLKSAWQKAKLEQDSCVATDTLVRSSWLGPKGETYTISLRGGLKATCVRSEPTGAGGKKTFDMWFDDSYNFLWWGIKHAFFIDLADLLTDPSQVKWYDGNDWSKRWNPRFVWTRSENELEESLEQADFSPAEPVEALPMPLNDWPVEAFPIPEEPAEASGGVASGWQALPPGLAPPPGLENFMPPAGELPKGLTDSSQDESEETRLGSEHSDSDTGDSTGGRQVMEFTPQKAVDDREQFVDEMFTWPVPEDIAYTEDMPRTKLCSSADAFVPLPFVPAAEVAAAWEKYAQNAYYATAGRHPPRRAGRGRRRR